MIYTKENDILILKCINEARSITEGINKASLLLKRKVASIHHRYYRIILKPKRTNKKGSDFTKEEDEIIVKILSLYPTNLSFGFNEAGIKLNKPSTCIENRYYYKLRNKYNVLTCGSKQGFSSNVKNTRVNEDGTLPEQNLNKVQWLLKELLELSLKDRKKLLSVFE